MAGTWDNGSSAARTPAELEAAILANSPRGFVSADIDSAIMPWDDPLGLGFASTSAPFTHGAGATSTSNRGEFHRCISGGVVARFRTRIATSSGNWDIAVYDNTGSRETARPNNRLWSLGSGVPVPAGGLASVVVSPTMTLKARQHWLATAIDNATASISQWTSPVQVAPIDGWGFFKNTQYPLPNPAPTLLATDAGSATHIMLIGRPT